MTDCLFQISFVNIGQIVHFECTVQPENLRTLWGLSFFLCPSQCPSSIRYILRINEINI
jgi:hypothetical protein